jgi:dTDP-4-dehydrorhamnose reductase
MKKLIITGASGFLGGHIFSQAEKQYQCVGTFNNYSTAHNIPNWRQIDLCNFFDVFELITNIKPDVIMHSAANSNLDDCEKNPEHAQAANVLATGHLVSAARQVNARFIYVSTDMVFDGAGSLYKENDRTNPLSVYGQTKLQAEEVVQRFENSAIVRSALIYGRPKFGGSSFSMWMENRFHHNQIVPLYVDQFRSPILVDNLAEILLELCDSDFTGILHAGGANRIDRFSFGQQMCDIFGYETSLLQPTHMSDHTPLAARPRDVSLNIDKAISILKTNILTTEQGLHHLKQI